ncbi:hypothetical protein LIPSTDRAFT_106607 [Lipomyces starkeyi NRRL Y-11557]|uniref:Uncharacterized protein n=1 Tax=Lipomyces starkeyi NRRL Y-11557 TaxID=675824 RepID=A0A1E3PZJ1_LIPST|nr:hypothetical protein LIPSTDRAFT_106607 [Lipomyces starkeyi NRRL Y-11557]
MEYKLHGLYLGPVVQLDTAMDTDEEIRVREMRSTILANEPDHEHEFKLSEESYYRLVFCGF